MDGRGEECGGNPNPPGSPHSRGSGAGLEWSVWGVDSRFSLVCVSSIVYSRSSFRSLEALSRVGVGCQQTTERSKISFSPVARGIIEDSPLEYARVLAV